MKKVIIILLIGLVLLSGCSAIFGSGEDQIKCSQWCKSKSMNYNFVETQGEDKCICSIHMREIKNGMERNY